MRRKRKRIKRKSIVGPAVDKDVAHEAVGVRPASLVPKEIPVIKKKNPVLQVISGCFERSSGSIFRLVMKLSEASL